MDPATVVHLIIGALAAFVGGIGLFKESWGFLSFYVVSLVNVYLLVVLIEAACRSAKGRRIENGVLKAKEKAFVELPDRVFSIPLIALLLFAVVVGFANLYIADGGIVYVGPSVEKGDIEVPNPPMTNRLDAVYYSAVTITTLGYGDFLPSTSSARTVVLWQLATGLELIVGIFALLIARLADF